MAIGQVLRREDDTNQFFQSPVIKNSLSKSEQKKGATMKTYRQLSIFLENRPGVLAEVTEEMARRKINLIAMTVTDAADHAVVRMLTSDDRKAVHMLEERGVLVVATEVLLVNLPNRPGAMAGMSRALSRAGVNIDYCYGSTPMAEGTGIFVLHVGKVAKAKKALARLVSKGQLTVL
jgi:hypothetical protein